MTATAAPARAVAPDDRNVITPDAYRLEPALLGTPLARPARRGAAMAVDGIFIAMLANVASVFLPLVAAAVLFRSSKREKQTGFVRRSVRVMLRLAAAGILFVALLTGWGSVQRWFMNDDDDGPAVDVRVEGAGVAPAGMTGAAGLRLAADLAMFSQSESREVARERLDRIIPTLRGTGMSEADLRETLTDIADVPDKPWLMETVEVALGGSLPSDTVARLQEELARSQESRAELAGRIDELEDEVEQGPGILTALSRFADDLGLGFGWGALYFTTFIALWQGRTPGKWLLGIRVIRLDAKPIGWWAAFERFGGYAAGLATGLLGFLQIYWDRNRQAVHDKICETVVIREKRIAT